MREKQVENEIKKYLKEIGCWHFKLAASSLMPVGLPDIIGCYKGRFIGIEVKRPKGGIQSLAQQTIQKNINRAGGIYLLANSVEIVREELENV